ncbi:MAG: hypothetical protein RLZZ502_1453 [Pseudomonadota bacterium]|jgi:hypothetical protein
MQEERVFMVLHFLLVSGAGGGGGLSDVTYFMLYIGSVSEDELSHSPQLFFAPFLKQKSPMRLLVSQGICRF